MARNKQNILIYDDENMKYYHGKFTYVECEPVIVTYEHLSGKTDIHNMGYTITFKTANLEETNNIELDETTMRRIAKFNKEKECERLDEEIKKKKEIIKELDDKLKDKQKRWEKVKKYISEIYEIDINDDDYDDDYDY